MTQVVKHNSNQSVSTVISQENTQILEVLRSKEPNFYSLKKSGELKTLEFTIIEKVINFLKINFMQAKHPDFANTAIQFSADIIMTEPTWNIKDIDAFLTFIRTRRDILSEKWLGEINSIKMMDWVVKYNEEKADTRVEFNKGRFDEKIERLANPAIAKYVKMILKTIDDGKPKRKGEIKRHEFFDPIINQRDYDKFIELIKELEKPDKEKYRKDVFNYQSSIAEEMERRDKLLKLLE